jgi:GNAT superfamily N-acetyltransferase
MVEKESTMSVGYKIREAQATDAAWMQAGFTAMGWQKPAGYFATCCRLQGEGALRLLVAQKGGDYVGHVIIVWEPAYEFFRARGIPEIQDLNILPAHRRHGVATLLLDEAERLCATRSARAGIGVGLYADYGPAQRLYVRRGYVPDGQGLLSHDRPVPAGYTVRVDDDLVLRLVKPLRANAPKL